jgi:hypothetical protein
VDRGQLRAQFSAQKQGTWPQLTFAVDYLVVAGGGGGGANQAGGGGAGGYRTSFPGGTKLVLESWILSNYNRSRRKWFSQHLRVFQVLLLFSIL